MSENTDIGNIDLSTINRQDLDGLLNAFDKQEELDYKLLDDNDEELSEEEGKIREQLEKNSEQREFIKSLIKAKRQIEKNTPTANTKIKDANIKASANLSPNAERKINDQVVISEIKRQEIEREEVTSSDGDEIVKALGDININEYTPDEAMRVLKYLNEKYTSYENGGEVSSWVSFGSTINDLDNKTEVNTFQDELIELILLNDNGFDQKYIKGFNSSKGGNYIMSIKQFEGKLRNDEYSITGDKSKDSTINSRLLGNYFLYLNSTGNLNEDSLINILSVNNIIALEYIFKNEDEKEENNIESSDLGNEKSSGVLREILIENGLYETVKNTLNMQSNSIDEGVIDSLDIDNNIDLSLHMEFIINNPSVIQCITDKDKLSLIIKEYNKSGNNSGENLELLYINKSYLRESEENLNEIILNNELFISPTEINLLPDSFYENNIEEFFEKYPEIGDAIIRKGLSIGINTERLIHILEGTSLENNIGNDIKDKLNGINVSKAAFLESYNIAIKDGELTPEDSKNITNYILNNPEYTETEMIELAKTKKGYYGENDVFKFKGIDSVSYGTLLLSQDLENIAYINNELLGDYEILKAILTNPDLKNNPSVLGTYVKKIEFYNLNSLLEIFYKYSNEEGVEQNNVNNAISHMLLDEGFKGKVYGLLKGNNQYINSKYSEIFDVFKNILSVDFTNLNESIKATGENLKKIVKGEDSATEQEGKEENKEKENIKKISTKLIKFLQTNNIEISIEEANDIINKYTSGKEGDEKKGYLDLKGIIENTEAFQKDKEILGNTIIFLEKLEIEQNIEKQNIEEQKMTEGIGGKLGISKEQLKVFKESVDNYLKENSVNKFEDLNEEKLAEIITILGTKLQIDLSSKEKKEEIYNHIKNLLDSRTTTNTKIKESQNIINNIDSYVKYMENPNPKNTFEEHLEIEKQIEEGKIDESKLNNEYNDYFFTNEQSYVEKGGGFAILGQQGEEIEGLIITEEEMKTTMGNPEATENLINFYKFFGELNLESVWKYRENLLTTIGSIDINFVDNDSLSKGELIKFGNSIITAINGLSKTKEDLKDKPMLSQQSSLSGLQSELRKFSKAGTMLSDEKTSNKEGEDAFAATLRNFGIIGGAYFKTYELRKLI